MQTARISIMKEKNPMLIRISFFLLLCLSLVVVPSSTEAQVETFESRQWASIATATSQYGDTGWNAMQASGAPNSVGCGDIATAWASESSTGQDQLTLMYDLPVVPTEISVYQTYNPGAITGIELILADGSGTVALPDSADPGTGCPGVWHVAVPEAIAPVNGVIITLDQTITGSWNEIDAVELIGSISVDQDVKLWASSASATSQYGNGSWSAQQATGAANTTECADFITAWASASMTGQDSLTAMFPYAVMATQVDIYETYNPGAITSVELILADQSQVVLENSADPGTPCPGVFSLPVTEEQPVMGIVIHLDQTITQNWNEIDAVRITGKLSAEVIRQWASGAEATSQYSDTEWSAAQATGAPNATDCGDLPTAWTSELATGQDKLTLTYSTPVIPTQVIIYQTNNPGAITGIELILADGSGTIAVPDSADPRTDCPAVFIVNLPADTAPVNGVIITIDQTITGERNEIDAVELVGKPAPQ
jgi:hypothetical protein